MPVPIRPATVRKSAPRKTRRGAKVPVVPPQETPKPMPDDAFACFTQWASEIDRAGYADLL